MNLRRTCATAAVVVASIGLGAPSAAAHTSTYCGHGADGVLTLTRWVNHVTSMSYPYHFNRYDHFQWHVGYIEYLHGASTACPGGI